MNYAIMRIKGVSGTNGWRSYRSNKTQKAMANDIRGNEYTVVRMFSQKEVEKIKSMDIYEAMAYKNYKCSIKEIQFVQECF